MKPIKLSECDEGTKIALPSWQNGQKYRVVYRVCEPTTITRYVTKIVEGVKKRQRVEIPAVWLSHMEPGPLKLVRENVVDQTMIEVKQKMPTLDDKGDVWVFLI